MDFMDKVKGTQEELIAEEQSRKYHVDLKILKTQQDVIE